MKFRLAAPLSALLIAAAASSANAAIFTFTASLSSAGEPIPVSLLPSTATGNATVTFNDVAGTVGVNVSWAGLQGSAPFGHIHCCTAVAGTGSAGVLQGFGLLSNVSTGSYANTFTPAAATFSQLLAGTSAGQAYVNIHSSTYPGGEIRGFLAPIPEPETYALLLAGLGAVAWAARRRSV